MLVKPYRLLLVDDEEKLVEMMAGNLEIIYGKDVLEIIPVTSPKKAMEIVNEKEIHIAILDINMPEVSGDQLLRNIKKTRPECEIVMLTGNASFAICASCYYDGASDYLQKPSSLEEMRTLIDKYIQKFDRWAIVINQVVEKRSSHK